MQVKLVPIRISDMSDAAILMLVMLAFAILMRGGWWLMNWRVRHPRPLLVGKDAPPSQQGVKDAGKNLLLPALFRLSARSRLILYILLLAPPVAAIVMMIRDWDGIDNFLMGIVVNLLSLSSLLLFAVIFLLCPYSAWNIYWRRKDFIRIDKDQIEYWSGFKSGKLFPAKITMFRGRSWRFDLLDLFRGQMASSWFLEIVPGDGKGTKGIYEGPDPVILDLKAMNLGGSARAIATIVSQVYGDKFLVNNELPG